MAVADKLGEFSDVVVDLEGREGEEGLEEGWGYCGVGGGRDEGEEGELGWGETVLGLILFDGEGVVELVAMFDESLRV